MITSERESETTEVKNRKRNLLFLKNIQWRRSEKWLKNYISSFISNMIHEGKRSLHATNYYDVRAREDMLGSARSWVETGFACSATTRELFTTHRQFRFQCRRAWGWCQTCLTAEWQERGLVWIRMMQCHFRQINLWACVAITNMYRKMLFQIRRLMV